VHPTVMPILSRYSSLLAALLSPELEWLALSESTDGGSPLWVCTSEHVSNKWSLIKPWTNLG
jgi:hypothetical protein